MSNSNETLSQELVEDTLIKLNEDYVLMHLRSLLNGDGTFFDTEQGYIQENDESTTGTVLDMYLDAINGELDMAIRDLEDEGLKAAMKKALEPNSFQRRVLLAYWNLNEDSPWYQAEQNITSYQTYKYEDFPNAEDISRVLGKL